MCGGPTYTVGPKYVCRRYPTLNVTGAPPRVGSLHRTPPVLRIIPEHQRGLHAGEENAVCHGFTPSAALGTPCHTRSVHRKYRCHRGICAIAQRVSKLGDVLQQSVVHTPLVSTPLR